MMEINGLSQICRQFAANACALKIAGHGVARYHVLAKLRP